LEVDASHSGHEATWCPVEPKPPREVWLLELLDEWLPLLLPPEYDGDDDQPQVRVRWPVV
jgi:hypothetical protein